MKISYNWLQKYFEEKLPEPDVLSEGIIFHSFEVEEMEKIGTDTILDIKILPDRAHDCLSHFGIAKEISAIFDIPIRDEFNAFAQVLGSPRQIFLEARPDHSQKYQIHPLTNLKIEIQSDKCIRYMGRIVRNIKVKESPEWLKEKLKVIGQKSINNIVDSANYVMFDLGQPIHCFDLDKLSKVSSKEQVVSIKIRNAKIGEKITTLDRKEIDLDESILVIADETDPLAIAGIKGGTKAEVDINTKNIVIEVANFNPTTTRKSSKKINILTDAVKRYENELSPELCILAMTEITAMIFDLTNGEVEETIDIYPKKQDKREILVSLQYINKRLGSNFSSKEVESVWNKLKFEYTIENNLYKLQVPFLRLDLTGPHDLTEEVIRILGYDRLPEILPEIKKEKKINGIFYKMLLVRNKLLEDGYSEVMNYVFKDKGEVEVMASANGKNFLRNNLIDGLKESIKLNILNAPLLEMNEIKVFEIGTIFLKDKEEMMMAYGDKKNVVEMTLDKFIEKNNLEVGDLLDVNNLIKDFRERKIFIPWSIYPFISRDIAVWVLSEVESDQVYKVIKENVGDLLVKDPYLFDKFTKPASSAGEKAKTSFAYRLVFQSYDRNLTDEEINKIMLKITEKIVSKGWEVR